MNCEQRLLHCAGHPVRHVPSDRQHIGERALERARSCRAKRGLGPGAQRRPPIDNAAEVSIIANAIS